MAAGFSESYVRLWSLKGEKLKGLRSDFQTSSIGGGWYSQYFIVLSTLISILQPLPSAKYERKADLRLAN